MAATTCWDCGVTAHMTPVDGSLVGRYEDNWPLEQVTGCFKCDNCMALNIAIARRSNEADRAPSFVLLEGSDTSWLPMRPVLKDYPDVPTEVASAASEAHRVLAVEAHRAAILLARSVIEATAKNKGVTAGRLPDKIRKMHEMGSDRHLGQGRSHPHQGIRQRDSPWRLRFASDQARSRGGAEADGRRAERGIPVAGSPREGQDRSPKSRITILMSPRRGRPYNRLNTLPVAPEAALTAKRAGQRI
jgi:hypothetical protein